MNTYTIRIPKDVDALVTKALHPESIETFLARCLADHASNQRVADSNATAGVPVDPATIEVTAGVK